MKKLKLMTLLMAGFALYFSACSKMDERRLPAIPEIPDPEVPPGPAETSFQGVLDENGNPLATVSSPVPDGQIYIFNDGKSFILSSRGNNPVIFSTQIAMKNNGQIFGANCTFESTDCSGECHLDANHGTPDQNALLVANNWGEVEGLAARVYQYDGLPSSDQVREVHSRMDLFGDGPYCSNIAAILDHYYTLIDVTASYPNLNNTDWKLQY